ncbi:hypothetical protein [Burkholderia pyrrocinia]|uniref:Uncharacterized protein n=1 Tax=Burkholderia pyrrocinia TaxID=60550 RepID=A0ABZ3BW25_BURPY
MKPPKNHNRHINMPASSHDAYWYFKIVTLGASEFLQQREYCGAAKMPVDSVRTFDVVAQQSPHDGRARHDDFFTSTESDAPRPPRIRTRWGLALGHHGSSLDGKRLQTDRIQRAHLFR